MPRLLSVGHVCHDRAPGGDVVGGSVTYGSLTARRLGWEVAILSSAGPDFDPDRELPGVPVFLQPSAATTRFVNEYARDGTRQQTVTARADDIRFEALPEEWRAPDALLLGPLAGELKGVGATASPRMSAPSPGATCARSTRRPSRPRAGAPGRDLPAHVLFLSQHDLPADARARVPRSFRSWRSRGWRASPC
jgi:hypothetical protein